LAEVRRECLAFRVLIACCAARAHALRSRAGALELVDDVGAWIVPALAIDLLRGIACATTRANTNNQQGRSDY
jgi:hypothetical protein